VGVTSADSVGSLDARPTPPAEDAVRVVIADDHVLYRRGLQLVMSHEDGIDIVGEAADGEEAVAKAIELVPDVVLMDVRMPRTSGIQACQQITEQVASARILMLTMSDDEADLFEAVKAGASGYLLKDLPGEEVAASIIAVHRGQSLISPPMAAKLLAEFAALSRRQKEGPGVVAAPRLTDRELEVLKLVARGMANKEIARELFISENTVKNHVRNILEKLQLHSRMEAAMYAVREKLLDNER
jgi:DNA-binding NarL/FixJ family response regulator